MTDIDLRERVLDELYKQEAKVSSGDTPPGLSARKLAGILSEDTGLSIERTRVYVMEALHLLEASGDVVRVGNRCSPKSYWEMT